MIGTGETLPGVTAHDAVLTIERIYDLRRVLMGTRHQNILAAGGDQPPRAFGEVGFISLLGILRGETAHLERIGRQDGGLGHQELPQRHHHFLVHELIAAT